MAEKQWCASKYMNSIAFRKVQPMERQFPRATYHATWHEAHAALVERREQQLQQAERAFQSARQALKKAKAMEPPQEPSHD